MEVLESMVTRPLKRSIQKNIEDLLSEELLRNPDLTGTINIDYKNDKFVVKKTRGNHGES